MNIRPLQLEDLVTIGIDDAFQEMLRAYIQKHGARFARIGEVDGKAVFACGISPFWDGVGEAWVRVFDDTHALGIIRSVRRLLDYMRAEFQFHRIEATVRADDVRTLKFDQWLGFDIECTKREFFSDHCDAVILRYNHGT